jgi:hypothetical protein
MNKEREPRWIDFGSEEKEFLKTFEGPLGQLRSRLSPCPDPNLITAVQADSLPEEERQRVVEHLVHCQFCSTLVQDLASCDLPGPTADEKNRIRENVFGEIHRKGRKPQRSMWIWLMRPAPIAAFGILALILITWVYFVRRPVGPAKSTAISQPPPLEVTSAFRLDKPPARLPPSTTIVWRGGSQRQDRYVKDLDQALDPYRADDFAKAAQRLEVVSRKYTHAAEAEFYLGVCYLFLDRNTDAAESLTRAQKYSRGALIDSSWYLSLAYYRQGDTVHAAAELETLCQGKSEYTAQACAGLKQLSAPDRTPSLH